MRHKCCEIWERLYRENLRCKIVKTCSGSKNVDLLDVRGQRRIFHDFNQLGEAQKLILDAAST